MPARIYDRLDKFTDEVANTLANEKCGYLHLDWLREKYWYKICTKTIIPILIKTYDKLVQDNFTEQNPIYYGDADGCLYYIPTLASVKRKVIYQNDMCGGHNYLYVLENENMHIRYVYRKFTEEDKELFEDLDFKNIDNIIQIAGRLSEYADDNAKYPKRRSLDFYKNIDFEFGNFKKTGIFCDSRDSGYIVSLSNYGAKCEIDERFIGTLLNIVTIYMGVFAATLEFKTNDFE